jgi:branched-subunit amino acid transport protein
MHRWGHGYRASQHCAYFLATLSDVLSSILTSSTRIVTVVGVYIVMVCPWTDHILARNPLLKVEADLS